MNTIASLQRPMTRVLATLFGLALGTFLISADDLATAKKEAADAVASFKKADPTLAPLFESSVGYAIFPKVGKGGFVVAGAHGTGLVFEKGKAVGETSLSQATIGLQAGGQSFSEVVFFETAEALAAFKKSDWSMNAQVGAVAAAEGAGKNAKFQDGVAVFTVVRTGLMAEASVGGQKFTFKPLP